MKERLCLKCRDIKTIDNFYKESRVKIGVGSICKVCIKKRDSNNLEKIRGYKNKWNKKNLKKMCKYQKTWRDLHRFEINRLRKERIKNDICFKIACRLRTRIYKAIKRKASSSKAINFLGCSIDFLKGYLEGKFVDGMTWENYGKWHIDHIFPCCNFDLSNPEQQKECFHYTNLQPLWAIDNMKKGGRLHGL